MRQTKQKQNKNKTKTKQKQKLVSALSQSVKPMWKVFKQKEQKD